MPMKSWFAKSNLKFSNDMHNPGSHPDSAPLGNGTLIASPAFLSIVTAWCTKCSQTMKSFSFQIRTRFIKLSIIVEMLRFDNLVSLRSDIGRRSLADNTVLTRLCVSRVGFRLQCSTSLLIMSPRKGCLHLALCLGSGFILLQEVL